MDNQGRLRVPFTKGTYLILGAIVGGLIFAFTIGKFLGATLAGSAESDDERDIQIDIR
jgi:hypothetical protein